MSIKVNYLKSAVFPADYPDMKRPEIAVAGRSNAGKSSFINSLTKSKIAKISKSPGKTRLLSFFDVGEHYRLVDMPGYGYAARSGSEVNDWESMVETYLTSRENLKGLILVMDVRREWSDQESLLVKFMNTEQLPTMIVLTKEDKLKKNEILQAKKNIIKASGIGAVFTVSNLKTTGIDSAEEYLFREFILNSNSET